MKTLPLVLVLSLISNLVFSQNPNSLSIAQLLAFDKDSAWVSEDNISSTPLATRLVSQYGQLHDSLSASPKVLYCPDGMNNLANSTTEQEQFNLFNFTNWQYIDIFCWFGGTVQIPTKPWIDAAHRNGVKIIGCLFLAPNVYGGTEQNMADLLVKDADSNFIAAQKLREIADYYGFDGWIMNFETNVSSKMGSRGLEFMQYYKSLLDEGEELIWYDALLESGNVSWQNQFNSANAPFAKASTGMFTNYWWSKNKAINSNELSIEFEVDPFDVYMGADMWPNRNEQTAFTNYRWLDYLFLDARVSQPLHSMALFAMNFTMRNDVQFSSFDIDSSDYDSFYDTEQTIFGGLDVNPGRVDGAKEYKGLGNYIPTRTTINRYPFKSNFGTGHGLNKFENGQGNFDPWHFIGEQDILPSWQFAQVGDSLGMAIDYDFEEAYRGGNSIKYFSANLAAGEMVNPLYSAKLDVGYSTVIALVYKNLNTNVDVDLALYFDKDISNAEYVNLEVSSGGVWDSIAVNLSQYKGRTINKIGIRFNSNVAVADYQFNLGQLLINVDVSIEEEDQGLYEVYPNPSTDQVYIQINGLYQESAFSLFNNLGQLVLQKKLIGAKSNVSLSEFEEGVYHYSIDGQEGQEQKGKLILM